jgi:hypothetical protein
MVIASDWKGATQSSPEPGLRLLRHPTKCGAPRNDGSF